MAQAIQIQNVFNLKDTAKISTELEADLDSYRKTRIIDRVSNSTIIKSHLSQKRSNENIDEVFGNPGLAEIFKGNNYNIPQQFKEKKHTIQFNDSQLESYFTKAQIIHLANGVKEDKVTKLVGKLVKNIQISNEEWVFLIKSVENILIKYGAQVVASILETSSLPHTIGQVGGVFNAMNSLAAKLGNPCIRLRHKGAVFFLEHLIVGDVKYNKILTIGYRDQSGKRTTVGHLGSNGHFYKNNAYKNPILPTIQLILKWNSNMTHAIAHYGLTTGQCSICGRTLTDKTSIKIGIGPICRKYLTSWTGVL